ncbi:olfactory receptor 5J3-like [Pelodiscus sinensis]|uniref:olfactory receptor 5J3-like n=1 Tax=Pelodiscus sinensis TaxID=13735 RepID=UPI0003C48F59|nr:olfactory receptor 1020-like [Pelodiscus sinensis]|eukprot:XP_006132737.1 olfactory receptor 1020-like [Pelodiscus sinensis]
MANRAHGNKTSITEFILLGFQTLPELQFFLFLLFLVTYIVTVAGNLLILALVVADHNLHTPMYFFLGNLSCLETCYSSIILPKMLAGLLTGVQSISFSGCLTQYYFFGSLVGTECFLLSVMSYDRYLAICHPLRYTALMRGRDWLRLAGGSWIGGFLGNGIATFSLSLLTFCGPNTIDHFLCDLDPLIRLSCNDSQMMETLVFIFILIFSLVPFLLTVTSYICIIATILRIPSTRGRQKAFSTCSSHLIVVTIYYGTLLIVYMFPTTDLLGDFQKVVSIIYTVLTPLVNPLIYSLRNKEVKDALRKVRKKFMFG